jgi:hypothetical protein
MNSYDEGAAAMPRDEPLDDLPPDEAGLISPQSGTGKPKTQALPCHHANAQQRRRPKTLTELRVGSELVEIYDGRFPGRMAARAAR